MPSRFFVLGLLLLVFGCAGKSPGEPPPQFVQVEGQPEPVPAEWVSTPAGRLAHSIKAPNPLPKDSGYRSGMTSEQYFEHLCRSEAGVFIFKTADNVDGLYLMRPPNRPTDQALLDRYKLEAPGIERAFRRPPSPQERGKIFVNPPWALFSYVEEPNQSQDVAKPYLRIYGYKQYGSPMTVEAVEERKSKYGLVWRGLKRAHDREHNISGGEWIVIDLGTSQVLAVERDYAYTKVRNVPGGIWWMNAINCPDLPENTIGSHVYRFVTKVLTPAKVLISDTSLGETYARYFSKDSGEEPTQEN